MSSGSLASYREADAFCEEPDDGPAAKRTHCRCGAFLPQTPTGTVTRQEERKVEWRTDYTGLTAEEAALYGSYPVVVEWDEWQEPAYACTRCGTTYDEAEMWED